MRRPMCSYRRFCVSSLARWFGVPAIVLFALLGTTQAQTDGTWVGGVDDNYDTASNWAGSTIANGAEATADFSTLDINGDQTVLVNSDRTLGHLAFGDTGLGSAGTWFVGSANSPVNKITLDAGASQPTITVNELTPTAPGIDDTFIADYLGGTNGFRKLGDGILTLDGAADIANFAGNDIMGVVNIDEGTLRIGPNFSYFNIADLVDPEGPTINEFVVADGATLEVQNGGIDVDAADGVPAVTVPAGATATVRGAFGASFIDGVSSTGTAENPSTLNVELATAGEEFSARGDWSGFQTVNVTGLDAGGTSNFRLRPNGGGFFNDSFLNTVVNLENVVLRVRTNSFGNNIDIGELHGDADSVLSGGIAGGGVARYVIGALNTDSDFAGDITFGDESFPEEFGPAGLDLIKVGTGTLTLSGDLRYRPLANAPQAGDPARRGGVTRVTAGTLALVGSTSLPAGFDDTGTATNFGILLSTVNVEADGTLDVSGATGTYSTAAMQQVIGSGTIVGNYNHDEGILASGDDNVVVGIDQSAQRVPTAGTITFDNDLSFNGGEIVYDMSQDPNMGNDLIQVNGSTMVGGGATITPNFLNGVPESGTYTILNSTGPISGSTAGWSVVWPGRGTPPSVQIAGNELQFTAVPITGGANLNWRGTAGDEWNINGSQNFHNNGTDAADVFFDADEVTFADTYGTSNTAVTNTDVSLLGDVAPVSVTVDSTLDYSITGSGRITGVTGLTKRGSGTLALQTANTFSGPASIEEGTVDLGNTASALGTGALTLSGVTIVAANTTTQGMTNSSMVVSTGTTNTFDIAGNAGNTFDLPAATGDGDLNITSTVDAKLIGLGDMSGFSGNIAAGPSGAEATTMTLRVSPASSMPDASVTLTGTSIANRAGGGGVGTIAIGALTGDANSFLDGFTGGSALPGTNFEIGALGTSTNFAGSIIDGESVSGGETTIVPTSLTKVGTGTLTLSSAALNTYTGNTSVLEGTLSINSGYLADDADVFLATGAVFDLNFNDTDVIDSLFIDGVSQPVGTYGASGSGAMFITNLISGNGILEVTFEQLGLVGDYNENGVVDAADYTVWRDSLGSDFALPNRDPNNIGNINQDDYDSWVTNFGNTMPGAGSLSSQSAVPEPSSLILAVGLVIGMLSSGASRRRRMF